MAPLSMARLWWFWPAVLVPQLSGLASERVATAG